MDARLCEDLWRRHADRFLLYATTILGDRAAAEDALQNVFSRLLERGADYDPDAEAGYLFRAVRNEALNLRRSLSRTGRVERMLRPDDVDPRRRAELAEWAARVEVALRSLDPDEREAVVLRIWGGLTIPAAAEVADVSGKTLEHRYYRGLDALKRLLGESDE